MLSIIAAIAEDGAIGAHNTLLWRLPNDMRRFKELTTGHTVIMGRKTFESLPNGALPNRRNVVISSNIEASFENATVYPNVFEAIQACRDEYSSNHFDTRTSRPQLLGTRTSRLQLLGTRTSRPQLLGTRTSRPQLLGTRTSRPHCDDELFIIGGSSIYHQTIDVADKLYITRVHHHFDDADAFFPQIIEADWLLTEQLDFEKDEKHRYPYTFQTYIKKI